LSHETVSSVAWGSAPPPTTAEAEEWPLVPSVVTAGSSGSSSVR
jgi:hypothetical protein